MSMPQEDIPREPPLETDLYGVLGVKESATPEEIRSAYKKQALKHHPDKAPEASKDEANQKFQQIAFAYAILSDERRRRRFDTTGSTAEAVDEDGFDWMDFYREQFSSMVDTNKLDELKREYQGSEEEQNDLLNAFTQSQGDLDRVYESVMLCSVLDDDERFRAIIDKAIADGRVENFKNYAKETKTKRTQRLKRAQKEAKEAEKLSKELDGKKGKGKSTKRKNDDDIGELGEIIRQRRLKEFGNLFDHLTEKYTGKKPSPGSDIGEPPEEMFEANRQKSKKQKQSKG